MRPDPTLRQLEYFVAVADASSMSGAAANLHVSQSAISLAVAALERQLQVRLFARGRGHGLSLTPQGATVLVQARRVLGDMGALLEAADASGNAMTGPIVVGCYQTLTPFVMPPVLSAFGSRSKDVTIDFREGGFDQLCDGLMRGQLELAILYDLGLPAQIVTTTISVGPPARLLLHADHPLAGEKSVSLRQVADEPFILYEPAADYYLGMLDRIGFTPDVRYQTGNFEAVRCLVARGLGCGLLTQVPRIGVSYEGLPVALCEIEDEMPELRAVVAQHAEARLTQRANAFVECCVEVLRGTEVSAA